MCSKDATKHWTCNFEQYYKVNELFAVINVLVWPKVSLIPPKMRMLSG